MKSQGGTPSKRQGSNLVAHGKSLFLYGGCDYEKAKCYKGLFEFNTVTGWWKMVEDIDDSGASGKEE